MRQHLFLKRISQRRAFGVIGQPRATLPRVLKIKAEMLNREIFYTLKEAQVTIKGWRQEHNTFRPHSSLGYCPPAPEALLLASDMTKDLWLTSKGLDRQIVQRLT